VYNIEQLDQDLNGVLPPSTPLRAEWRADLLRGVKVITGRFADGSPLLAIPNFARFNRYPPATPRPAAPAPPPGTPPAPRPAPPPPLSIVWIRET
jgi:hypothetical protein